VKHLHQWLSLFLAETIYKSIIKVLLGWNCL